LSSKKNVNSKHKFVVGEVYFAPAYADPELCYPTISSFVYLGMNFSKEDTEDTWYFQPTSEFARYGSAVDGSYRGKLPQARCEKKKRLRTLLTVNQLARALREAEKKRHQKKEGKQQGKRDNSL
jgi:hypothetical protein